MSQNTTNTWNRRKEITLQYQNKFTSALGGTFSKVKLSVTGKRTLVSRDLFELTGGDTDHYTITDWLVVSNSGWIS